MSTIKKEKLDREFIISNEGKNKKVLSDSNPLYTPAEVLKHYSALYPELTNGSVVGPEILKNKIKYTIKPHIGTKG